MLGIKRKVESGVLEPWVDFHIRRFKIARQAIVQHKCCIGEQLSSKKLSWVQHIARFGFAPRQQHFLKLLILWRNLYWWKMQQKCRDEGGNHFRHAGYVKPSRYEDQFHLNWMLDCSEYWLNSK